MEIMFHSLLEGPQRFWAPVSLRKSLQWPPSPKCSLYQLFFLPCLTFPLVCCASWDHLSDKKDLHLNPWARVLFLGNTYEDRFPHSMNSRQGFKHSTASKEAMLWNITSDVTKEEKGKKSFPRRWNQGSWRSTDKEVFPWTESKPN